MFKTLLNAAGNAIELSNLDDIVNKLVESYDKQATSMKSIENIDSGILNTSNANKLEEDLVSSILSRYDGEAESATGRKVEPTWLEGGGTNVDVRKRMLNRKLQERKNLFLQSVESALKDRKQRIDDFSSNIDVYTRKHVDTLKSKIPLIEEQVRNEINSHISDMKNYIESNFPGGLNALNSQYLFVYRTEYWNKWHSQYKASTDEILVSNAKLVHELMESKKKDAVEKINRRIQSVVDRTRDEELKKIAEENEGILSKDNIDGLIELIRKDVRKLA